MLGPVGYTTGRCLVKFGEGPIVILGTDYIAFTVCSVRPHGFLKFKCPA